ncbi:thiamine-monophosphate kinase [Vulcanimicrobium alpinum]|uniref:Thiamine-monophosphate kinase n=1 Tax=Vulcanimicrobium alpinum TaxID=3016050 RepID=A0AAN1XVF1_UNVUL|nr:thiamine-phosphate kinase [Vulcanimicrobium alpinum]BDE06136.1 thiamine-monophosphate kinase [Vulcanimicrobium alpinum]
MTEDALVAQIRERLRGVDAARLSVGIGDDAAVWQPKANNRSVITTDAMVEGVHFRRDAMPPEAIGHRVLAANLSDIAAMGARPVLATIALGFPPETDTDWLLRCYDGVAALAARAHCTIAGGDLTRAPAILFSVTVIGEVRASNVTLRSGARPGDVVALTGPLGASRAGLLLALDRPDLAFDPAFAPLLAAYRTPEPRLREGRWLGASRHVHAMIDTSDGLSTDLGRLCAASGTGAEVDAIPVHAVARALAERTGDDPERWALDGGEDFELLAAIDRHAFGHLANRFHAHTGRTLLRVGRITGGAEVRFADGIAIAPSGWDHLR